MIYFNDKPLKCKSSQSADTENDQKSFTSQILVYR